jgi:hypothetical protein
LRERQPGPKVLYTTGCSRDAIVHKGRPDADVSLLCKPCTFEQLAAQLRKAIDGPS